jgi:hypothetical protein
VDRRQRAQLARDKRHLELTPEELAAESDRSPGVLMASGYIAGGAIAGILIAFIAGVFDQVDNAITKWATASNPFFHGPQSDLLALIPFVAIVYLLYRAGTRAQPA